MTKIDRDTAIALAKEAGMLVLLPTNPLYKDHSLLGNMSGLERLQEVMRAWRHNYYSKANVGTEA